MSHTIIRFDLFVDSYDVNAIYRSVSEVFKIFAFLVPQLKRI